MTLGFPWNTFAGGNSCQRRLAPSALHSYGCTAGSRPGNHVTCGLAGGTTTYLSVALWFPSPIGSSPLTTAVCSFCGVTSRRSAALCRPQIKCRRTNTTAVPTEEAGAAWNSSCLSHPVVSEPKKVQSAGRCLASHPWVVVLPQDPNGVEFIGVQSRGVFRAPLESRAENTCGCAVHAFAGGHR